RPVGRARQLDVEVDAVIETLQQDVVEFAIVEGRGLAGWCRLHERASGIGVRVGACAVTERDGSDGPSYGRRSLTATSPTCWPSITSSSRVSSHATTCGGFLVTFVTRMPLIR